MLGDKPHDWKFVSIYDLDGPLIARLKERIHFADAGEFRLEPPVHVASDSAVHEQGVYWAFETGRFCAVPSVDIVCLEDAVVTQEGVVFLSSGECVLESIYPWTSDNVQHRFGSLLKRVPSSLAARDIVGDLKMIDDVVHLREPGEWGYFHWVNSVMPRLAMIDRVASLQNKILAVDPTPRFAAQTLALLGLDKQPLLPRDHAYRVRRLWMTSPTNLRGDHFTRHPFWTAEVRRRLTPKRRDTTGRRIYLSRDDSKVRRVLNEEDLVKILKALWF